MRKLVAVWLAVLATVAVGAAQESLHVRVFDQDPEQLAARFEALGYDVLEGSITHDSVDLIVTEATFQELVEQGFFPTILARSRPFREIQRELESDGVPAGYPSLAEITTLMNMTAANFPAICKVVDLTTTYNAPPTYEQRHLLAVKISDNVEDDENEPAMLIVSCHHAREIVTPVIALLALEKLTTLYGTDPTITALVDKYEIWIAPVWNPDGYVYVFDVNNMWRKNRRPFGSAYGVDLNRNYPLGWSAPCSGSNTPSSETYKGDAPASEAETKTMLAWSDDRHFCKVVDYHSYGREALYSYLCLTHPFTSYYRTEAQGLSSASGYGGAVRTPSAEGEHYEWQLGVHSAFAFLVETHTTFQPTYDSAKQEAALVWPGILWMLQRPIPLTGNVTAVGSNAPLRADITIQGVTYNNGEKHVSNARFGRYHLFLPVGNYNLTFTANGYVPLTIPVTITTSEQIKNVQLTPLTKKGDMNCDGNVDFGDINPFVLALSGREAYEQQYPNCNWLNGDVNNDGDVNFGDINPFVQLLAGA